MAWSDEPWVVEGAAVRVSIVGQDDGSEAERTLDGEPVGRINSNLTTGVDLTQAERLAENRGVSFMGDTKGGAFDIPGDVAREMLRRPMNVNGYPNSDVVVPWVNGLDLTRRPRDMFIIDFGTEMTEAEAADYEAPSRTGKSMCSPCARRAEQPKRTGGRTNVRVGRCGRHCLHCRDSS